MFSIALHHDIIFTGDESQQLYFFYQHDHQRNFAMINAASNAINCIFPYENGNAQQNVI